MKKIILVLSIILFTTQAQAQQAEFYKTAITQIEETLKSPDLTVEQRQTLRDLLRQTNDLLNELKSDAPTYGATDNSSTSNNNDHAPAALAPEPTREINGGSNRGSGSGKTVQAY